MKAGHDAAADRGGFQKQEMNARSTMAVVELKVAVGRMVASDVSGPGIFRILLIYC